MRIRLKEIIQLLVMLLLAIASGVDMIGQRARTVNVLGLTVAALGCGIAIGKIIERRRLQNPHPDPEKK